MKKTLQSALAAIVLAAPIVVEAGKPAPGPTTVPLKARVFATVVDKQDTDAYFHDGGITGCPDSASDPSTLLSALMPDATVEVIPEWNVTGWTATSGITAGIYNNGTYCASSSACLRAEFNSGDKTLSLDTRTTAGPLRKFTLDLSDAWDLVGDHAVTNIPAVGQTVVTPGLFEVLGSSSIAGMGICSSRACLEAREYPAKFWFLDSAGATWRVDWTHMRVLRVATNKWYFMASDCDGSQVAGLSKLEGSRTRPREVNQGYFLVPFFISVER